MVKINKVFWVLILILIGSCARREPVITTLQKDGPTCHPITIDKVHKLYSRWNESLHSGKSEDVSQYYTKHAYLLPTLSNKARTSRQTITQYFDEFLAKHPDGVVNSSDVTIDCNTAIDTGTYTFTLTDDKGVKTVVPARYTFVYTFDKETETWLIKSHHSSLMPAK
jgi:uncharacterized protein (TIGR02246 family)